MDRCDAVDALQLDDHEVLDQHVDAITDLEFQSLIENWESDLGANLEPAIAQFL